MSKNQVFVLSLNTIEKELITDNEKILNYFKILEKSVSSNERKDLIKFKKALYLIKTSNIKEGKEILNNLIDSNSTLKSIAQELIQY